MIRRHFESRAELGRQMVAARRLRAETLRGAVWIVRALSGAILGQPLRALPASMNRLRDIGRADRRKPPE